MESKDKDKYGADSNSYKICSCHAAATAAVAAGLSSFKPFVPTTSAYDSRAAIFESLSVL